MARSKATAEQICIRLIPETYKNLTEITERFKNVSVRGWTHTAVINALLSRYTEEFMNLPGQEASEMFGEYVEKRDGGKGL